MRMAWLVVVAGFTVACAGPHVPVAPPISAAEKAYQGVQLEVCTLTHQRYDTSRSTAVAGGDGDVTMTFTTVVVKHPTKGLVLIDPSIGQEKKKDFAENHWAMRRVIGDGSKATALEELLLKAGIDPQSVHLALVTHAHWDHICGATDVPTATIMMREPDLSWADNATLLLNKAVPPHEIARIRSRIHEFKATGPAYEGFSSSFDVFGDGSIVGVPTPGHTPGSTSWFVNSGDGRRWLFIGDAAWSHESIELPAHKGWVGRLVDDNKDRTGETLGVLHAFAKARPVKSPPDGLGVQVVPAHDAAVMDTIPACKP